MVDKIRNFLFKKEYADLVRQKEAAFAYARGLQKEAELRAGQRVAEIMSKMDPFEPVMKLFHGIFSEEFEHPEENLDAAGQLRLTMWAYQQTTDPAFKHITQWVMNSAGNETVKRAPVTVERSLYGRAQIASMALFVKEIERLGNIYADMLEKNKLETFDEHVTVEE